MLSFDLLFVIIAVIGNFILGLFTLRKNPKSATNLLFFLFTISITTYIIFNFLVTYQKTDQAAFFWVKAVMSNAVFINLLFFLLTSTFPSPKFSLNRKIFWASTIFSLFLAPAAQLNLIFISAKASGGGGVPGIAMPFFLLHTALYLGGGFITLVKTFRKSNGFEKEQVKLFLFGTILMFISILFGNLLLILIFNNSSFIGLLPIYTLIFISTISYAIVKNKFLDINLLVARSVVYTLLVFIIALFYTGSIFSVTNLFFNGQITRLQAIIYSVFALFVALTYPYLKQAIEKLTDKVLFKNNYDSNELLSSLTKIMASTLQLEDLTRLTLHKLLETVHISKGAFLILEEQKFYPPIAEGFDNTNFNSSLMEWLCSFKKILIFDEEENPKIKIILRQLNFSVVLPLFVGQTIHGLLVLGDKKSGEIYSSQDIKMLEIFGPEVSVAVQNSKAYEEIKRFNITLKEEIDKATKDLQVANKRLEELDKIKDDFVSVASHELRTPMTAVRSYAWMALNRPDVPLSEKLKKYLQRTLISTERLINLVNDMLNISRIESGKIEINPQAFDVETLVDDVLLEVGPKAKEKNLHLVSYKTQIPKVFADPDKVHQVLLNLVGNALKFTPENGGVSISFFTDGQMVDISIKDTGVGISSDDQRRLFQKFGRLDYSYVASATSGGTGLGLFICKSLVSLMKGKIWAESDGINMGSTFSFSLPAATPEVLKQAGKYTTKVDGEEG
ncbi:hypothetical protein HY025_05445 [Candidatus Daviesbacteria bacterium]|nr:hypothetical protein [Candidatus Daviesbacteria bacterium]